MAAFEKSANWNYSVAWVDTLARGEQLGRGIFMRGRHASADQLIEARARQAPLQGRTRASLSVPMLYAEWTAQSKNHAGF